MTATSTGNPPTGVLQKAVNAGMFPLHGEYPGTGAGPTRPGAATRFSTPTGLSSTILTAGSAGLPTRPRTQQQFGGYAQPLGT